MFWFSFQEFLCAGGVWKFFLSPDDYQNRRLSKGFEKGRYCAVPGARRVARRRAALSGGAFPGRVRECEEVPQERAAAAAPFRDSDFTELTDADRISWPECEWKKRGRQRALPWRGSDHCGPSCPLELLPRFETCKAPAACSRGRLREQVVDPHRLRFGINPPQACKRRGQ